MALPLPKFHSSNFVVAIFAMFQRERERERERAYGSLYRFFYAPGRYLNFGKLCGPSYDTVLRMAPSVLLHGAVCSSALLA